jgi:hypothetical protein
MLALSQHLAFRPWTRGYERPSLSTLFGLLIQLSGLPSERQTFRGLITKPLKRFRSHAAEMTVSALLL